MAEPRFADDDDLPRTLRRERDQRERELREREAQASHDEDLLAQNVKTPAYGAGQYGYAFRAPVAGDGTVTRLQIPFVHLVVFLVKAVVAAIPALVLLTILLWGMGQGLKAVYPDLRHFEIIVRPVR